MEPEHIYSFGKIGEIQLGRVDTFHGSHLFNHQQSSGKIKDGDDKSLLSNGVKLQCSVLVSRVRE